MICIWMYGNEKENGISRHLATRRNNKIRRTALPPISISEEIFPRLTRRTLAQLITNRSPFLKSYLHDYDPSVTLTYTTHILASSAPTYVPHCHPLYLWTDPAGVTTLLARWMEKLAGGPQAGRSDSPTSKGHGSG